jgi:hypothetical protein
MYTTALRAQGAEILSELLPVGRTVSLGRREIAFPIEYDHIAIVGSGDRICPPGDQFAGVHGCGAV